MEPAYRRAGLCTYERACIKKKISILVYSQEGKQDYVGQQEFSQSFPSSQRLKEILKEIPIKMLIRGDIFCSVTFFPTSGVHGS